MFCPRCGAQHDDKARFCPKCGQTIGGGAAADLATARQRWTWVLLAFLCALALAGLVAFNWFVWPGPQLRSEDQAAVTPAVRVLPAGTEVAGSAVTAEATAPDLTATMAITAVTPSTTATSAPRTTPSREPTATQMSTTTPWPTAMPLPTLTPTPTKPPSPTPLPACTRAAGGDFVTIWQSARVRLGCPTNDRHTTWSAIEPFQYGWMYWRQDADRVYAMQTNGNWRDFADIWEEGEPESAGLTPPPGLLEPKRGFGKVWREKLGGPQAAIGWAEQEERGVDSQLQDFEHGVMLAFEGRIYVFYRDNGSWAQH
jgi:hypothetical protein